MASFWFPFFEIGVQILVKGAETGSPSSSSIRMKYLFPFQFLYSELGMKNQRGRQEALFC